MSDRHIVKGDSVKVPSKTAWFSVVSVEGQFACVQTDSGRKWYAFSQLWTRDDENSGSKRGEA